MPQATPARLLLPQAADIPPLRNAPGRGVGQKRSMHLSHENKWIITWNNRMRCPVPCEAIFHFGASVVSADLNNACRRWMAWEVKRISWWRRESKGMDSPEGSGEFEGTREASAICGGLGAQICNVSRIFPICVRSVGDAVIAPKRWEGMR